MSDHKAAVCAWTHAHACTQHLLYQEQIRTGNLSKNYVKLKIRWNLPSVLKTVIHTARMHRSKPLLLSDTIRDQCFIFSTICLDYGLLLELHALTQVAVLMRYCM